MARISSLELLASLLALTALPSAAHAQTSGGLTLKADGGPSTLTDTHSTSYILVTGTKDGAPGTYTCLPNKGCTVRAGYTNVSSRLIFDAAHETLTSCTPASAPGECVSASGIVKARLDVKMGKLRIISTPGAGYGGLPLWTPDKFAKLVFDEDGTKYWPTPLSEPSIGSSKYWNVRAGSYSVVVDPLVKDCKASQLQPATVAVPEGDAQTTVTVYFKGNDCTVTVAIDGAKPGFTGTIESSPPGMSCSASTCTGTFPFGTKVLLSPKPAGGATGFGWHSGSGCVPTNAACKVTVKRDPDLDLTFTSGTIADAGPWEEEDASAGADSGTDDDAGPIAGKDGGTGDAGPTGTDSGVPGTTPGDDAGLDPAGGSEPGSSGGSDDGSCATAHVGHATTNATAAAGALALGIALLLRGRRRSQR